MLDRRGDEMRAAGWLERFSHPAQGKVVSLGPATREHHLGRLAADQCRDRAPRLVEDTLGALAKVVDAGRVSELVAECADHHLQHHRVDRRRGVMVEIDPHRNFPS